MPVTSIGDSVTVARPFKGFSTLSWNFNSFVQAQATFCSSFSKQVSDFWGEEEMIIENIPVGAALAPPTVAVKLLGLAGGAVGEGFRAELFGGGGGIAVELDPFSALYHISNIIVKG